MTANLIYYTILLAGATVMATRGVYLFEAWKVTRGVASRVVGHQCDDPENCPAEMVLAEMQDSAHRVRIELALLTVVLALTLIGLAFVFVAIAR